MCECWCVYTALLRALNVSACRTLVWQIKHAGLKLTQIWKRKYFPSAVSNSNILKQKQWESGQHPFCSYFQRNAPPRLVDSCGGCPVGTWGVSQVNLMKNSGVIGSWMAELTKARLGVGSEVKIVPASTSGLLGLAHWILHVTKFIFAITNWLQLV